MGLAIGIYNSGNCNTNIPIQPPSARLARRAPETILIVHGSQTDCKVVASTMRLALAMARGAAASASPIIKKKLPTIRLRIIISTSLFTITDGKSISVLNGADLAIQGVNVYSRLPLVMHITRQNFEDVPVPFASGSQSWPMQMYVAHQCNLGCMITGTDMETVALIARIGI